MKKKLLLILIIGVSASLVGCWDMREVNDLGVCVAVGVDTLENGLLEVTVQIIVPRLLAKKEYAGNAIATYSATGRTTFEIFRKITTISSREIYLGHIQLLVLGEDIAKKGIFETLDFFERDHEIRRQALVLVAKDTSAREILETGSVIELIPAVHLAKTINNTVHTGTTRKITLIELFQELNSKGDQIVLPTVITRFEGKPKVVRELKVVGAAVFDGDKLAGYLDEYEARGYLWSTGRVESSILVIPTPHVQEDLASVEVISAVGKIDVEMRNDTLHLTIRVETESNIAEQQGRIDLTSPEMMNHVEKESSRVVKREIKAALHMGQKVLGVDFFGFGEVVSKNFPEKWKEVQEDWSTVFSNTPVEIVVESAILGSGQILEP